MSPPFGATTGGATIWIDRSAVEGAVGTATWALLLAGFGSLTADPIVAETAELLLAGWI